MRRNSGWKEQNNEKNNEIKLSKLSFVSILLIHIVTRRKNEDGKTDSDKYNQKTKLMRDNVLQNTVSFFLYKSISHFMKSV